MFSFSMNYGVTRADAVLARQQNITSFIYCQTATKLKE